MRNIYVKLSYFHPSDDIFPPGGKMTDRKVNLLMVIPMGKKRNALPIWFSAANSSDTGRPLNS